MYQASRISRSEFVPVRTLNYHVRVWGQPLHGNAPLVLLHGWMDVAASYQFVVDALALPGFIIAPDWRGFGLTDSGGADCFWHPDYLADLDALLDHYSPHDPVHLVGHSMGGNVAMMYAGIRPLRVQTLINLEGFGMPTTPPEQAPARFAQWMDELRQLHLGGMGLKAYASLEAVAHRLMKTNERLTPDKARWLAEHWAQEKASGQWSVLGEIGHKISAAQLYRVDEALATFRRITAPTLMVESKSDHIAHWWKGQLTLQEHRTRLQSVAQLEIVQLPNCGHMLHHDQPERLAQEMEGFWSRHLKRTMVGNTPITQMD